MKRIYLLTTLLALGIFSFYSYFQSTSIYGGDAGDLVTAAYSRGIPHPPGYPLYTFLAHLATYIPYETIAWRVSLVSSIPLTIAAVLLFILLRNITKSLLIASIGTLLVVTNYIIWLFAIVPEVYGLHALLVMSQIVSLYEFKKRRSMSFLYLFICLFALSLAHHPAVWFLVPGYAYWLYRSRSLIIMKNKRTMINMVAFFILGLLPYLYIPIAASANPYLSWENPVTIQNFFDLITMSFYGSFQSSANGWTHINSRFMSVWSFVIFLANDFSILGIVLILFGMYTLYKKDRDMFFFIGLLLLFSGPFLLFYAVFAIQHFSEYAVVEQFLIVPYFLCVIFFSMGMVGVAEGIVNFIIRGLGGSGKKNMAKKYGSAIVAIFIIFPISYLFVNYEKLYSLKDDRTAEQLAQDILASPQGEKPVIILLVGDAGIFNTQYVYYTSRESYPDIHVIHADKMFQEKYHSNFAVIYPGVTFPKGEDPHAKETLTKFIDLNKDAYDIYANANLPVSDGVWVPRGLLVQYYPEDAEPETSDVTMRLEALWSTYQNPYAGSLSVYENLALSDVISYYEIAHIRTADYYLKSKDFDRAIGHVDQAIEYHPLNSDYYYLRSIAHFGLDNCGESEQSLIKAIDLKEASPKKVEYVTFLKEIYEECLHDEQKAVATQQRLDALQSELEIPLSEL